MLFAIVDIETTGGRPTSSRITEICVVVSDGQKVLSRYETLLNPGSLIPSGITSLTGITNEMVSKAPVFADIAQELYHLLHDKVFVAHNVNFDYGFIQNEFAGLGMAFSVQKLCSAKSARKAFPGYSSYSLGNICGHLRIPIHNRHRAGGDADATAELMHRIFSVLGTDIILNSLASSARTQALPPNIDHSDVSALPTTPGVYYFMGSSNKVLYTGKAINIRKRVLQHFDTHRGKTALQLEKIQKIDFVETGSELLALLTEAEAIQRLWPEWNVAGKLPQNRFAVVHYTTVTGEIRLQTVRRGKGSLEGIPFSRLADAKVTLATMISQFGICSSRAYSNKGCTDSDCYCQESEELRLSIHNSRVLDAIESVQATNESLLILCPGRNDLEKGVVHMHNGAVAGWGFCDASLPFPDPDTFINPYKDIAETRIIAASFLRRIASGQLREYAIVMLPSNEQGEFSSGKKKISEDGFFESEKNPEMETAHLKKRKHAPNSTDSHKK